VEAGAHRETYDVAKAAGRGEIARLRLVLEVGSAVPELRIRPARGTVYLAGVILE